MNSLWFLKPKNINVMNNNLQNMNMNYHRSAAVREFGMVEGASVVYPWTIGTLRISPYSVAGGYCNVYTVSDKEFLFIS